LGGEPYEVFDGAGTPLGFVYGCDIGGIDGGAPGFEESIVPLATAPMPAAPGSAETAAGRPEIPTAEGVAAPRTGSPVLFAAVAAAAALMLALAVPVCRRTARKPRR